MSFAGQPPNHYIKIVTMARAKLINQTVQWQGGKLSPGISVQSFTRVFTLSFDDVLSMQILTNYNSPVTIIRDKLFSS